FFPSLLLSCAIPNADAASLLHRRFDHPVQFLEVIVILQVSILEKADVTLRINDVKLRDGWNLIRTFNPLVTKQDRELIAFLFGMWRDQRFVRVDADSGKSDLRMALVFFVYHLHLFQLSDTRPAPGHPVIEH